MISRKELKTNGKKAVKRHYWLFLVICLFAAFISSEFESTLDPFRLKSDIQNPNDNSSVEMLEEGFTMTNSNILELLGDAFLHGNIEESKQLAQKREDYINQNYHNKFLGRSRGIISGVINSVTSGKAFISMFEKSQKIFKSDNIIIIIFALAAGFLHIFMLFFIKDCFVVITRRVFLEGRVYEKVPPGTLSFLIKTKKWLHTAFTMFVLFVYRTLWMFTIIGIPIKHYSYFLVPYIAAENPDMKANEAITLSQRMMNGHKWECFKIYLSFLPWFLLDLITLNLTAVFYTNSYRTAVYCEYYAKLREEAVKNNIPGVEKLNDKYLFEKAPQNIIVKTYEDVIDYINEPMPKPEHQKGIRSFLEKWFGIMLTGSKNDLEREKINSRQVNIEKLKDISEQKIYPDRLSPQKNLKKRINLAAPEYLRYYSIPSLILMFFIFSFIGWCWEVSLHLVKDGVFVNRGVMHGPWLPIYGAGGILILVVINRMRKNALLEFFSAVVLCGIVEYFTSWYLEMHYGQKWWDYSGYFLNLNGRICAEGLLTFGLGGMAIVYGLAPAIDNLIRKIKLKVLIPICIALMCIYTGDQVYSSVHPNEGKGITDYDSQAKVQRQYTYEARGRVDVDFMSNGI